MQNASATFTLTGPDPLLFGLWRDLNANGKKITNLSVAVSGTDAVPLSQLRKLAWTDPSGNAGNAARLANGHFWIADSSGNMVDGGSASDISSAQSYAQQAAQAAANAALYGQMLVFPEAYPSVTLAARAALGKYFIVPSGVYVAIRVPEDVSPDPAQPVNMWNAFAAWRFTDDQVQLQINGNLDITALKQRNSGLGSAYKACFVQSQSRVVITAQGTISADQRITAISASIRRSLATGRAPVAASAMVDTDFILPLTIVPIHENQMAVRFNGGLPRTSARDSTRDFFVCPNLRKVVLHAPAVAGEVLVFNGETFTATDGQFEFDLSTPAGSTSITGTRNGVALRRTSAAVDFVLAPDRTKIYSRLQFPAPGNGYTTNNIVAVHCVDVDFTLAGGATSVALFMGGREAKSTMVGDGLDGALLENGGTVMAPPVGSTDKVTVRFGWRHSENVAAAFPPDYAPGTTYIPGRIINDPATTSTAKPAGTKFRCLALHTADGSASFASQRLAYPTLWEEVAEPTLRPINNGMDIESRGETAVGNCALIHPQSRVFLDRIFVRQKGSYYDTNGLFDRVDTGPNFILNRVAKMGRWIGFFEQCQAFDSGIITHSGEINHYVAQNSVLELNAGSVSAAGTNNWVAAESSLIQVSGALSAGAASKGATADGPGSYIIGSAATRVLANFDNLEADNDGLISIPSRKVYNAMRRIARAASGGGEVTLPGSVLTGGDRLGAGVVTIDFGGGGGRIIAPGAVMPNSSQIGWSNIPFPIDKFGPGNGFVQTGPNAPSPLDVSQIVESFSLPIGDETTAITAGTNKLTFRMPYAFSLQAVRGSLTTAQTGGTVLTFDVKESGASIFSTKPSFNNGQRTTVGAATPAIITDTTLADDAEITVDVLQVGDGTAKGLKVTLIGTRA